MITQANGLLAGAASLALGIGAHAVAGAGCPDMRQLVLLVMIAVVVAMIRGGQTARDRRQRNGGHLASTWKSIAALLIGGQVAAHLVLTVFDTGGGHHHDVSSIAMVGWHAAALPASVVILAAASWLLRVLFSTVAVVRRPLPLVAIATRQAAFTPVVSALHDLVPQLSVGRRAPPVAG